MIRPHLPPPPALSQILYSKAKLVTISIQIVSLMYILIANISEFKEIKGAFLPPLQITHPSVLPAVHPSAKL